MVKIISSLFLLALLSGCATQRDLARNDFIRRNPEKLYAIHHEADFFFNSLSEGFSLGLAHGNGDAEDQIDAQQQITTPDNSILDLYKIKDPAIYIKTTLTQELAATYNIENVVLIETPLKQTENKLNEIKQHFPNDGLILSVRTFSWMIVYKPLAWKHHSMYYVTKVSLFDPGTEETLYYHKVKTVDKKTNPTMHQLFAHDASVFRQMKQNLAEQCLQELRIGLGLPQQVTNNESTF